MMRTKMTASITTMATITIPGMTWAVLMIATTIATVTATAMAATILVAVVEEERQPRRRNTLPVLPLFSSSHLGMIFRLAS
jgi:hypothetical protein